MDPEKAKAVIDQLNVREAMSDSRYFVGRERLIMGLPSLSAGQRSPTWLFGAQRSGKSSIGREMQRQAEERGDLVIWSDLSTYEQRSFEDWLVSVVRRAQKRDADFSVGDSESGEPRLMLERLAEYSERRPVLLVFDEFDVMAMRMELSEQAFLRGLSQVNDAFTYVFISRSEPSKIIEPVEKRSRLTGACRAKPVPPLRKGAVRELCKRAFGDIGCDVPEGLPGLIYEKVGGIAVATMHLVCQVACDRVYREQPLTEEDISVRISEEKAQLLEELEGYWWDLHPYVRMVLLEEKKLDKKMRTKAGNAGFYDQRRRKLIQPEWLIEVGEELGVTPPADATGMGGGHFKRVKRMHSLMASINETAHLNDHRNPFQQTNETLKWFPLCKPTCSEADFRMAIDHLYQVFFEGASRGSGGDREFRFPDAMGDFYEGSMKRDNVIGHLSWIRNHFDHDKNSPDDHRKPNRELVAIGECFEQYGGVKSPRNDAQRMRIRDGLVRALTDHLGAVDEKFAEVVAP